MTHDKEFEGNSSEYRIPHDYEYHGYALFSLDTFIHKLNGLSFESAIIFNGIALLLCRKLLGDVNFGKYHKAVVNAIGTFKRDSKQQLKEDAISHAAQTLIKLRKNIISVIKLDDPRGRRPSPLDKIFILALDFSLKYASTILSPEKIADLLKGIRKCRHGVNSNRELDYKAFVLYQRARDEYERYNWSEKEYLPWSDDWVDEEDAVWEAESEEWDDEDNEYCIQLQKSLEPDEFERLMDKREEAFKKYIDEFSSQLRKFDNEHALILHTTVLNLMVKTVKPRVYAKYWRTVMDLVSTYEAIEDLDSFVEVRNIADQLLIRKHDITNRYPSYNCNVNEIGEFNLITTSTRISLCKVSEMETEKVQQMIGGFLFNEICGDFSNKAVENQAQHCLLEAMAEILGAM